MSMYWKLSSRNVKCNFTRDNDFCITDEEYPENLYVYQSSRLPLYGHGIEARLLRLAEEYWLPEIREMVRESSQIVCIDIGANIGEVTKLFHSYLGAHTVFAFEPEQREFVCLRKNASNFGVFFNTPLWRENTTMEFFGKNETGDSSLIRPSLKSRSVEVEARTLDAVLEPYKVSRIEVIKLEAEGAEPEIIEGAKETLQKTRFVTADLGPERGISKLETFEVVNTSLMSLGFVLLKKREEGRKVYLFERKFT